MKKYLFLSLLLYILISNYTVYAKEINFYFYPNGGNVTTSGFSVGKYGYLNYNDKFYASYKENDTITNINSINKVSFTVEKKGTKLVKGREWYFKSVFDGKTYYLGQNKKYDASTFATTLGDSGDFLSLDLYANWENKKVTNGIDFTTSKKSTKKTTSTKSTSSTTTNTTGKTTTSEYYVKIKLDMNGGKLGDHAKSISSKGSLIYANGDAVVHKIKYNEEMSKDGLANYNNSNYINIIKNNYSAEKDKEWNTKADGSGKTYSYTKVYKASDFCDASKKDCEVTLYVNWHKNRAKIKYNANGGSLSTTSTSLSINNQGLIMASSEEATTTINYDETIKESGLLDYNNSSYINLLKSGYEINQDSEWNTKADGTGINYSQAGSKYFPYKASDFCDVSKSDCEITLYANWKKVAGKIHVIDFYPENTNKNNINSDFIDGDAVVVESDNQYILMDAGRGYSNGKEISTLKKKLDNLKIKDLSIYVSHFHYDHCGYIVPLINSGKYNIKKIYIPKNPLNETICNMTQCKNANTHRDNLIKAANEKGIPIQYLDEGNSFKIGSASFKVMYVGPKQNSYYYFDQSTGKVWLGKNKDQKNYPDHYINDSSLVTMVTIGKTKYFTAGDIEKYVEKEVANKLGSNLKADIMKLNHHGGVTSNYLDIMKNVNPTYTFYMSDRDFDNELRDEGWTNSTFDFVTGYSDSKNYSGTNIYSQRYNGDITFVIYQKKGDIKVNAKRNYLQVKVNYVEEKTNKPLKTELYQYINGKKVVTKDYYNTLEKSKQHSYTVPYFVSIPSDCGGVAGYKSKAEVIKNKKTITVTCQKQ